METQILAHLHSHTAYISARLPVLAKYQGHHILRKILESHPQYSNLSL
ncbi:hypothetical protein L798_07191 [Zootermopsis nevadensis]|uniref:Uncharacterized protein n=1 Tax=Zootermopsis nevadensis TaxID=136037 RepID=A0A067R576_ZOONE|nr:hypothetical protein L798_07191 [Zootermopsis nevadensis]